MSSSAPAQPGQNCVPAPPAISPRAASSESAERYGRSLLIAWYASQTNVIRLASGICSPARPSG